jgi:hypothetical protein
VKNGIGLYFKVLFFPLIIILEPIALEPGDTEDSDAH